MEDLDDVIHPWLRLPLIVAAALIALILFAGLWRLANWIWDVALP